MKIRAIILGTAIALVAATSGFPAQAVAPKDAVSCDLSGPLSKLEKIKASGIASTTKELDVRKELLKASMDCNAREAAALGASIAEISEESRIAGSLKQHYSADLAAAASFAQSRAEVIDGLTTVEASKEMARQLREWRDGTYNLLAWRSSQLIVMNKNMALAASGGERAKQLATRIDALVESPETIAVEKQVAEASDLIEKAQGDLNDALGYLKDGGVPQQEQIASKQKSGLDQLSRAYELVITANNSIATIPAAEPIL